MSLVGTLVVPMVVAAGVLAGGLANAAWWNRHQPGIFWFAVHVGLVSIWSFVGFGSFVAEGTELTRTLGLVANGIGFAVSLAWFLFILQYLGYGDRIGYWQERLFVFGLGGIYAVLVVTSRSTGLLFRNTAIVEWHSYRVFDSQPSVVGAAALLFGFSLFFIGLGLLFHSVATGRLQPAQASVLIVGTVIPVSAGLLVIFLVVPGGVPLTQQASALSVGLYAFGLYRFDLFRFSPATERIGVDRAFEAFGAGVLVTEDDGQIIRVNDACCEILATPREELVGRSLDAVLGAFDLEPSELPATVDHQNDFYRVVDSTVTDDDGTRIGRSVLFVDITDERLREQRLDVLNRVLRHNLRNDLQVITATNELLASDLDDEQAELAQRAIDTADSLVATSSKARSVEQLLDRPQSPVQLDLRGVLTDIVEQYRSQFPGVSFTLTCPDDCVVEVVPSIEVALENVIENAAEHGSAGNRTQSGDAAQHNDDANPTVDITATVDEREVTITVTDNGPGISEHELAVLDQGEETPLQHGSGMGLWVVQWVFTNAAADIQYDTGPDGTTISVRIPQ